MNNIVITMAGLGSRFQKAGFDQPKYAIEANGRTLFEWSILSLRHFFDRPYKLIFVTLRENNSSSFIFDYCAQLGLQKPEVVELEHLTDGQATTALAASGIWSAEDVLTIYNIDTLVKPTAIQSATIKIGSDGWIPCFSAAGNHWSFVKVGSDGWAVDAAEKTRISGHASVGLYWFRSAKLFSDLYKSHFVDVAANDGVSERYIAPMYKTLIEQGGQVSISDLPLEEVTGLGTPEELKIFLDNREKYSSPKYMELA